MDDDNDLMDSDDNELVDEIIHDRVTKEKKFNIHNFSCN